MKIEEIDENFKGFKEFLQSAPQGFPDVEWRAAADDAFSLCGVKYIGEEGCFKRVENAVAEKVSEGVRILSYHTAGGRLRFRTDSPYVLLYCKNQVGDVMSHMTIAGTFGFSLYVNGKFDGIYFPYAESVFGEEKKPFGGARYPTGDGVKDVEIYFPLYSGVEKLAVGLKKGCVLEKPREYSVKKPIVFYGSSITQGGCASRPGNDYAAIVARRLDADFINLGFSGNAKGETAMAEYIAGLEMSAFVLDYDHNAPSPEHLEKTLYPFYETVRAKNKDLPIIFVSSPNAERRFPRYREIVREAYEKAKENGDGKVGYVDGYYLFGEKEREDCTVDACHPNDLGFFRMADAICPAVKKMLF